MDLGLAEDLEANFDMVEDVDPWVLLEVTLDIVVGVDEVDLDVDVAVDVAAEPVVETEAGELIDEAEKVDEVPLLGAWLDDSSPIVIVTIWKSTVTGLREGRSGDRVTEEVGSARMTFFAGSVIKGDNSLDSDGYEGTSEEGEAMNEDGGTAVVFAKWLL